MYLAVWKQYMAAEDGVQGRGRSAIAQVHARKSLFRHYLQLTGTLFITLMNYSKYLQVYKLLYPCRNPL